MYIDRTPQGTENNDSCATLPLFDLIACVSSTLDLINSAVANHHMRVASIANALCCELGMADEARNDVIIAAALHDIGGFSSRERIDLLQFEVNAPHRHALIGHQLLQSFPPFSRAAEFVRFHHVPWQDRAGQQFGDQPVPPESHLIHLADRIAVLIQPGMCLPMQAETIRRTIAVSCPSQFAPDLCEAFNALSCKDYFWMDAGSPLVGEVLGRSVRLPDLNIDLDHLLDLANFFRRIIDFRSPYTARHTSGVAAAAIALAKACGMEGKDLRLMEVAGLLHDLGKLAIPLEILEKPARLDALEYDIMRSHAWHTYRILEAMPGLEKICTWGALHQEYLDGSGYPFGLTAGHLPLGSRLIAVADVFTALAEDRPYRAAMPRQTVVQILRKLVHSGKLDPDVVELLARDVDEIDQCRMQAQRASGEEYRTFAQSLA